MVIAKKTTIQLIGGRPKKEKKERGDRDNDLVPVEKQLNGIEQICNDLAAEREKSENKTRTRDVSRSNNR